MLGSLGSPMKMTGGFDGSARVVESHGRYSEAVYRGNVYSVCDTAGRTTPAGLSASPICVSLFNPIGSGVVAHILYAGYSTLVAPAAAQLIWIGINNAQGQAATTGTALAPNNCNGTPATGKIKPLTTATLPAAPLIACDMGVVLTGAITVANALPPLFKWLDGVLQLPPGCALSFQASTAGGASGAAGCWIYEEVPITAA